jgi:hypothetical protein
VIIFLCEHVKCRVLYKEYGLRLKMCACYSWENFIRGSEKCFECQRIARANLIWKRQLKALYAAYSVANSEYDMSKVVSESNSRISFTSDA